MAKALLPFIRFYGKDWISDPKLRRCSPAARGVWADMISLAIEGEPYGHLSINGTAYTPKEIAERTSTKTRVVKAAIAELERNDVFGRTAEGVIFSRRMVRDLEKLQADKLNGAKGGNPKLKLIDLQAERNARAAAPAADEPAPKPIKANGAAYVFEGRVIRLTGKDFDAWHKNYSRIPDLRAELQTLDDKISDGQIKISGKWYNAVSAMLRKKHTDLLAQESNGSRQASAGSMIDADAIQWRTRLKAYAATAKWNTNQHGPKPGALGCWVPASILAEFAGLGPTAGVA